MKDSLQHSSVLSVVSATVKSATKEPTEKVPRKTIKQKPFPKGVRVDVICPLHKKNPLELFCVDDTELCCAMCKVDKLHKRSQISLS